MKERNFGKKNSENFFGKKIVCLFLSNQRKFFFFFYKKKLLQVNSNPEEKSFMDNQSHCLRNHSKCQLGNNILIFLAKLRKFYLIISSFEKPSVSLHFHFLSNLL